MRGCGALIGALLALGAPLGCSETELNVPREAGDERMGLVDPDSGAPMPDAAMRLTPHAGFKLSAMQLGIIYLGDFDAGGAPPDDVDLKWLLGSAYWLLLDEYGVGNGALAGVARVPIETVIQPSDLDPNSLVDVLVLQDRIAQALHGSADAGTPATISIPGAQAYVLFLPDGINVALGHRGTYTYQTCIDANGYHGWDGVEAYTVLPPCPAGRSIYAASHELSEMATDPRPYDGWASDTDIPTNGGEVADLCADETLQEGMVVTKLWSDQANGCVPLN